MIWAEAVHAWECVQKSMENKVSTNNLFEICYGEKPKIIGSFSEFGRSTYVTKGKTQRNK